MGPYTDPGLQGVTVTITPTTGCFAPRNAVFRQPSGYYYTYSPNPASDDLTVSAIDADKPATSPPSTTAPPFEADLYDNYGKKVKTKKSDKGQAKLDVRDLPNGLYNLRVGTGKEAISEHIVINH